jgi:hypothetical protein
MGIYALSLAGSNYFAPIICGFIADGQGWQWVFYWPAIFNAITFVILFFLLEETNYNRKTAEPMAVTKPEQTQNSVPSDPEKGSALVPHQTTISNEVGTATKSFRQKLSIWQPSPGQNMFERAKRSLQYLTWPVIFYAGFSYGSYLIWFNVLNATASIILSGPGYNFRPSMVGLSYVCYREWRECSTCSKFFSSGRSSECICKWNRDGVWRYRAKHTAAFRRSSWRKELTTWSFRCTRCPRNASGLNEYRSYINQIQLFEARLKTRPVNSQLFMFGLLILCMTRLCRLQKT